MKWRFAISAAAWSLAAAMLLCAKAPAAPLASELKEGYQVTGTIRSTRDGAPVPFCRVSATPTNSGAGTAAGDGFGLPSNLQRAGRGPASGMARGGGRSVAAGIAGRTQRSGDRNPETKADASGRFSLELPHGGSWRVTAAARGFRSQAYEEHEDYYSSIVLSESSPTYEARFLLIPDSRISGVVLDEAGEPVPAALIIAQLVPPLVSGESRAFPGAARARVVGGTQADDRGRYELPNLAPGEYRLHVQAQPWYASGMQGVTHMGAQLVASADGFLGGALPPLPGTASPDPSLDLVYPVTWYPSSSEESGAETITLRGGEERQADFHLTAIPASHLMISRPDAEQQPEPGAGRPRPQRPVTITRVGSDGGFGQSISFGGNGREWDFGGLTPGTYEVRLPGPHGDQDGETRQIEVRPGAGGLVSLENSRPLTRVTIGTDGLPGSEVSYVEFVDVETGRRIMANAPPRGHRGGGEEENDAGDEPPPSGMSVMLPPRRYQVMVAGRSGAYVTSISASGAKVVGRTVEIGGSSSAAVTLHLANVRGELAGVASMEAHPVCGAMVLLVPVTLGQPGELAPLLRDQTNSDGSFLFQAVIPGRYILVAIDHGWGVNVRNTEALAKYLSRGVAVEIKGPAKLRTDLAAVLP